MPIKFQEIQPKIVDVRNLHFSPNIEEKQKPEPKETKDDLINRKIQALKEQGEKPEQVKEAMGLLIDDAFREVEIGKGEIRAPRQGEQLASSFLQMLESTEPAITETLDKPFQLAEKQLVKLGVPENIARGLVFVGALASPGGKTRLRTKVGIGLAGTTSIVGAKVLSRIVESQKLQGRLENAKKMTGKNIMDAKNNNELAQMMADIQLLEENIGSPEDEERVNSLIEALNSRYQQLNR